MELAEIVSQLIVYKYHILFPLLLIQGPVVAVIAGFLASTGVFGLTLLFVSVTIADLITDTIIYSLGRWGRWVIVARWGKYIGLTSEKIEKAEIFMEKYGHWALVISKFAYSLGAPTMILAGISQMKYLKFIGINFIVAIPKAVLLVMLGYYVGENFDLAQKYLNYIGLGILILVILGGIVYWKKVGQRALN